MSIKTGFPIVNFPSTLFTTAPFLTVATATGVSKLLGTLSAGTYIGSWNFSMTPSAGVNFNAGGFGAITETAVYGGVGALISAIVDVPAVIQNQVYRGNNVFLITVAVDTPIYVYWNLALSAGTWSATLPAVLADSQLNTLSFIKIV